MGRFEKKNKGFFLFDSGKPGLFFIKGGKFPPAPPFFQDQPWKCLSLDVLSLLCFYLQIL